MKKLATLALAFALSISGSFAAIAISPADIPTVRIVPGSDINLLSSSSAIPIRIQNDFDVDVRVQVHAIANNARISVPVALEVIVPAETAITAKLPVRATGVGQVDLLVWLETFSGLNLNSKATLHINVNPDAENAILIGFTVSIATLLTFGVIRTLRKRKKIAE
ncbi:MAG: DUF6049 family protein [Micrococcales bacterium]